MNASRVRFFGIALTVCFFVFSSGLTAQARSFRLGRLPDQGNNWGCATCHVNPNGGGPRNLFGQDYEAIALPAGDIYNLTLGAEDSDDDGFDNNQEFAANPATKPWDATSFPEDDGTPIDPDNHPPSIESVAVTATPDPPTTTSVLKMVPQGWQDEDGDPEGYLYRWSNQDGLIEGAETDTLDGSFFSKGDSVFGVVIPFDGVLPGESVASLPLTIRNTAPSFSSLVLDVSPSSDPVTEASVLTAQPAGWQDADADAEGYRYAWFNQNGPLTGTVAHPDQADVTIQGLSNFVFTLPFQLKQGQELAIPMVGIQQGSIRLMSPSGQEVGPFELPPQEGSDVSGNLSIELGEAGDYTVEETFQLLVQSTSSLIPVEALLEQQFTWTYSNDGPATRVYNYATSIRNLRVNADGKFFVDLNVPNPTTEVEVLFVIQETLPANSTLEEEIHYQADFGKVSSIATTNVAVTSQQITGEHFSKGDELFVVVTANDGSAAGNSIESEHLIVQNSVPVLASAAITVTPLPATVESQLETMASGWQDADDDAQQIRYQWYNQDGAIPDATGQTLTSSFKRGDVVSVEATPFDGTVAGAPVRSTSVTIQNTAPTKPQVGILPQAPMDGQELTWEFSQPSVDADGDPLTTQVRWYIGSEEQTDLAGQNTVPASRTEVGDRWRVSIIVSDGIATLSPVSSSFATVVAGNAPPSISAVSISPIPAFAGDTLSATVSGWRDDDGDPEQIEYQWEISQQGTWQTLGLGGTLDTTGQPTDALLRIVATPTDDERRGEARTNTVQLGGVIQNADGNVYATVERGSLQRADVRLVIVPYEGDTGQLALNSKGYYKPTGNFWQLAVEGDEFPIDQVLDASPVSVTLCEPQDATLVLAIEGSRLQSVDAVPSDGCLVATVTPASVWSLGISDAPEHPWDVNSDGVVDILDLVGVGSSFGQTLTQAEDENPDVTRDWVVDILDLVGVGAHFGESTTVQAAPSSGTRIVGTVRFDNPVLDGDDVLLDVVVETTVPFLGYQIQLADGLEIDSDSVSPEQGTFRLEQGEEAGTLGAVRLAPEPAWQGITSIATVRAPYLALARASFTEATLVSESRQRLSLRIEPFDLRQLFPQQTRLLSNYPNPFNPETWIPFQLHESAVVRVFIYDALGREVRQWRLGMLSPGYYRTRDRAIHWDGRNHTGEFVASGVYFYHLQTLTARDMRRMIVLK